MNYYYQLKLEEPHLRYYEVSSGGMKAECIELGLPDNDDRSALYMVCRHGLMCCKGFPSSLYTALGHAEASFEAKTIDDLMNHRPVSLSAKAVEMGITENMTGLEIFGILSRG